VTRPSRSERQPGPFDWLGAALDAAHREMFEPGDPMGSGSPGIVCAYEHDEPVDAYCYLPTDDSKGRVPVCEECFDHAAL